MYQIFESLCFHESCGHTVAEGKILSRPRPLFHVLSAVEGEVYEKIMSSQHLLLSLLHHSLSAPESFFRFLFRPTEF